MGDRLFIKCHCEGHAIELEKDNDGFINVYMWMLGFDSKYSFLERIKLIWHLLLGRKYMIEDYVLTEENAKQISDFVR